MVAEKHPASPEDRVRKVGQQSLFKVGDSEKGLKFNCE
jgi:hypothetical protein